MSVVQGYVHPEFASVAQTLRKQLPKNLPGGSSVCIYHKGEKVVDIWGGHKNDRYEPWEEDTLSVSFSTTKGVVSTLMHMLVDRGLASYEDPVAKHWPEFGANGKDKITIAEAMTHQAGLYNIRDQLEHGEKMLDWDHCLEAIANAEPCHEIDGSHGYHGFNYGYVIGGLIEAITKKPLQQVLHDELVDPLNLDGAFIGVPEDQLHRRALLVKKGGNTGAYHPDGLVKVLPQLAEKSWFKFVNRINPFFNFNLEELMRAFHINSPTLDMNSEDWIKAIQPAANGMFTARSLAKIYAAIANGGTIDGVQLFKPSTIEEMRKIRSMKRDRVLGFPMMWRMGYHAAFSAGLPNKTAFGHFGYGGSGAWADPTRNLSCALTLNYGTGTPMGDTRIAFVNRQAFACADRMNQSRRTSTASNLNPV